MPSDSEGALEIEGLSRRYGQFAALRDIALRAESGEFLALLGPSGSGKTTLLRLLAGLERPDAGAVRFCGEDLLSIPARRRRVGMVFQHYALFRHMTAAGNIAFGLSARPRAQRPSRGQIARCVAELLAQVRLEGLGDRFPAQLSGGQRQRVALARALAVEPRLLLLDEPFGALDAPVRRELRSQLRELHERAGVTTLFVTHDQEEAFDLADRVALLKDGELVQAGTPAELYDQPASAFAYGFLGPACQVEGTVTGGRLQIADWRTEAPARAPQGAVQVWFRPDEIVFAGPGEAGLEADVISLVPRGRDFRIEVAVAGQRLALSARGPTPPPGVAGGRTVRLRPLNPKAYPA